MYKGRYFIREVVYICGGYMDADIYPVFQRPGKRRSRCKPTSDIQAKLNQKNAERKVTRLIHNNFTQKDIALHLTYKNEPKGLDEAEKNLTNFLRRLKRAYAKRSLEFKYIKTTEYGAKSGRVHHHIILSGGLDRDVLESMWGFGYANSKRLQFTEEGVTGLAHYIVKDKTQYRRWSGSRNLIQPEPIVTDGKVTMEEIERIMHNIEEHNEYALFENLYPEYILTDATFYKNPMNRGEYIHYEMRARFVQIQEISAA